MQLQLVGPVVQTPLVGIALLVFFAALVAFVVGGILGPKLFAKLGMPGLALGVVVAQTAEQKLKVLLKRLGEQQAAAAVLNLPKDQVDAQQQAAIAEHFTSTT